MSKDPSLRAKNSSSKHRTTPLKDTLFSVPNYPTKLTLYQIEASRYWWVRYYDEGRIYRRSTKTDDKRKAIEFAKKFYEEIKIGRAHV